MRTNLEKYKYYKGIIDRFGAYFCSTFFPDGLPTVAYDIDVDRHEREEGKHGYFIRRIQVTDIIYHYPKEISQHWWYEGCGKGKKPTREKVLSAKRACEALNSHDMSDSNICFHVRDGRTSWGLHFKDFKEDGYASFDWEELELRMKRLAEKYTSDRRAEDQDKKQGKIPCERCGKYKAKKDLFEGEITYRMNGELRKKLGQYCKGTSCFSNEQMAHEG